MTTEKENGVLVSIHDDITQAHALLWTIQSLAAEASGDTITLPAYGFHQLIGNIREKTETAENKLADYLFMHQNMNG